MHHRHKVDAPSGTALKLGEAAAAGAGARSPTTRCTRAKASPANASPAPSASRRCAAAMSSASTLVVFAGDGERVEIAHRATSRQLFAAGALRAVAFVAAKRRAGTTGVFDMPDVLGLR